MQTPNGTGFRDTPQQGLAIPLTPNSAGLFQAVDPSGLALATLRSKGLQTSTITASGTSGNTTVTMASSGTVPNVGQILYFTDQTFEAHLVTGVSNAIVTLNEALTSSGTHVNVQWDIAAADGPTTSTFSPGGVEIKAQATYDAASGNYAIPRSVNGSQSVQLTSQVGGGATHKRLLNLAGTATSIKTTAGTLFGLQIINNAGASAYLQLFDTATASVTGGTSTPDFEVLIGSAAFLNVPLPAVGIAFTTAISAISTTTEGGATGSSSGVVVYAQYV